MGLLSAGQSRPNIVLQREKLDHSEPERVGDLHIVPIVRATPATRTFLNIHSTPHRLKITNIDVRTEMDAEESTANGTQCVAC